MKNLTVLVTLVCALYFLPASVSAQKRPVKKPAPAATPVVPAPKATAKVVSPAENFFNEGLKCDAKDYDCQVSNYTKAINVGLSTKAVFQKRAAAYTGRQDFEKAIADLTKVIEFDLNDASGYKDRGKAYIAMPRSSQNIQNAIKDFTSAIDLEPKDGEAYNLRGSAYLSVGMNDKASADLDKGITINPASAEAYINRGNAFSREKDFDKAIENYSAAIKLKPAYDALVGRGYAYLAQKKNELALGDFNRAAEIEPKKIGVYLRLGALYEKNKKFDEAIASYTKAIEIEPKTSNAYYLRGRVHKVKKNYDSAFLDFSKSIELDPSDAASYESRGMISDERNEYVSAIEDCSKAISLNPNLYNAYWCRADARHKKTMSGAIENYPIDLIVADGKQGSLNAISPLSREIAEDPENANSYRLRAGANHTLGNKELALADFKKVIELEPSSIPDVIALGRYYQFEKNFQAALDIASEGLNKNINNPEAHKIYNFRGNIYGFRALASSGMTEIADWQSAVADYQKALDLLQENSTSKQFYFGTLKNAKDALARAESRKKEEKETRRAENRKETLNTILGAVQTVLATAATRKQTETSTASPTSTNRPAGTAPTSSNSNNSSADDEKGWGPWVADQGYRGIQLRARLQPSTFQANAKIEGVFSWEVEIRNNYSDGITAIVYTTLNDKDPKRSIGGTNGRVGPGQTSSPFSMTSVSSTSINTIVTLYFQKNKDLKNPDGSTGRVAPYDNGSPPASCTYSVPYPGCPNYKIQ